MAFASRWLAAPRRWQMLPLCTTRSTFLSARTTKTLGTYPYNRFPASCYERLDRVPAAGYVRRRHLANQRQELPTPRELSLASLRQMIIPWIAEHYKNAIARSNKLAVKSLQPLAATFPARRASTPPSMDSDPSNPLGLLPELGLNADAQMKLLRYLQSKDFDVLKLG